MLRAVLSKDTGELMEYRKLTQKTKYQQLYLNSYSKEIGRLEQGMPGLVEGTNIIYFLWKSKISRYTGGKTSHMGE